MWASLGGTSGGYGKGMILNVTEKSKVCRIDDFFSLVYGLIDRRGAFGHDGLPHTCHGISFR